MSFDEEPVSEMRPACHILFYLEFLQKYLCFNPNKKIGAVKRTIPSKTKRQMSKWSNNLHLFFIFQVIIMVTMITNRPRKQRNS